ncbi:MAG: replicative DNA helicase [Chitinophagales bacterium]|nr:replicative DNA helicase [Chitinophagales bacterium]
MLENIDVVKKSFESAMPRKRENLDLSSYTFGKIPPQAKELEEAVLGAMMLEANAVATVIDILKPDSFYVNANRLVFQAIHNLFNKSKPIDILTVTEELKFLGKLEDAGGAYYVTELTSRIASAANVEHHARIVAQKYIQRELIRVSSDIIKNSYEDTTDVFELLDKAEQNLFTVADLNLRRNYEPMSNLLSKALTELEHARNHQDTVSGVPTGFSELDRLTGGWQKPDLIIIAARPGMGKTAFVLSIARNAAVDYGKAVAIFSLEMSSIQLVNRLVSGEAEIEGDKMRRGSLADYEWAQLQHKADKLSEAPIFIDDTPAINIFELRAKCRRLKMQHDVKLIIIDYLQLMSGSPDGKAGNREQEISAISRSLKSIAKELDVPIIALSQLSRAVETRGGSKRPQLSDLRESGAIEQDADLVIFLYRAEYYGMEVDEQNNPTRGVGELIVSKHRNGALRNIYVRFIDKFAKFVDADSGMGHERSAQNLPPGAQGTQTIQSKRWDLNEAEDDMPPPF